MNAAASNAAGSTSAWRVLATIPFTHAAREGPKDTAGNAEHTK